MQNTTSTPHATSTLLDGVLRHLASPAPSGRVAIGDIDREFGEPGKNLMAHLAATYPQFIANRGTNRVSYYWKGGPASIQAIRSAEGSNPAPAVPAASPAPAAPVAIPQNAMAFSTGVSSVSSKEVYIPEKDDTFIPWGSFNNVKKIISSKMFFPLYISGMSGNGKTMMVEQACAILKREYVRVQVGPETDEDDLLGGFRLIDGETVFQKGPVVKAMESGAILLIDELDRGTNKIMCLQGVLEGKPILLKKVGETVHPAPGFNVIATANTNGRGSEDGRYSAAQIIDDAFIERFVATIDQPYASIATEKKIVLKHMNAVDLVDDEEFADNLVGWSTVIRKTFDADGVDEVISTRRLCHIVKAYSIFGKRLQAIEMCINRFDEETREAFMDLYTKIDSGELKAEEEETTSNESTSDTEKNEPPF